MRQEPEYIYIFGEEQSTLLPTQAEGFTFAAQHMAAVSTEELESILASVFGAGQLFPGPDAALSALLHEYARRMAGSVPVLPAQAETQGGLVFCLLVLVFMELKGSLRTLPAARLGFHPLSCALDNEEAARQLVLDQLPGFQQLFLAHPCAPKSRLMSLLKEATLAHINKKLD